MWFMFLNLLKSLSSTFFVFSKLSFEKWICMLDEKISFHLREVV